MFNANLVISTPVDGEEDRIVNDCCDPTICVPGSDCETDCC
jgi:hypothetical protein